MMMQVLGTIVFSGAAATAGATLWTSVAPQWRRIVRLAAGMPDESYRPLTRLIQAERRIVARQRLVLATPSRPMREVA